MATIIDFTPNANEVESLAEQAADVPANIRPVVKPQIDLSQDTTSSREAGETFMKNGPTILFVCEYANAVLVAWEPYLNATHYEVFKRNMFSNDAAWSRILFIDAENLKKETAIYNWYVNQVLGLEKLEKGSYFMIQDTEVKTDRIYEYKVKASYFPKTSAIDYEVILDSKKLLNYTAPTAANDTVFSFAKKSLGSEDHAWIVSLLNTNVPFFGREGATKPIAPMLQGNRARIPKDVNHVVQMIGESIHFFGLKKTIENILNRLRDHTQVTGFYDYVLESIDESTNSLSYTTLQSKLVDNFPSYKRVTNISVSSQLNPDRAGATLLEKKTAQVAKAVASQLPITIPSYQNSVAFNSFADLSTVFLRLNTILIGAAYAYDNDEQIQTWIKDAIAKADGNSAVALAANFVVTPSVREVFDIAQPQAPTPTPSALATAVSLTQAQIDAMIKGGK